LWLGWSLSLQCYDPLLFPSIVYYVTDVYYMVQELKEVWGTVPEVRELVGNKDAAKLLSVKEKNGGIGVRPYLQSAFANVMTAGEEAVAGAISKFKSRLDGESTVKTLLKKE
jgi:mannose-6-phosphate isomerase